MGLNDEIKSLLDQGDYLQAYSLAERHKIADCRNICENLEVIYEIAQKIQISGSVITSLEDKINSYEIELRNIKDTAFEIEEKEHAVQLQCKNISDTCDLIDELIDQLSISEQLQRTILDGSLDDSASIEQLETALSNLEKVLNYEPIQTLEHIRCVREQKERAHSIRLKFCGRFYQHFTRYTDAFLSEYSESFINNIYSQSITLPGHDVIHGHLIYLSPVVNWLHKNDKATYQALDNFYIARSKEQYDKEFKTFFECARDKMRQQSRPSDALSESRKRSSMSDSLSNQGTLDTQDTASGKGSDISYTGWDEFEANVREMLRTIDFTCQSEQRFYMAMFPTSEDQSIMLVNMFSLLESELVEFANYYNSLNGLYSLYLLVGLSQYLSSQPSTHLLNQIYPEVLIRVKRNFDNFMEQQLNSIRDIKPPKSSKCGVLNVVKNFEAFAKQVESLVKSTGSRRTDVDRWYLELVSELFKMIDRIEHNRTPAEMIRLENYNYLHDVLRSIKVPCLEAQRREANLQYKAALNAYVTRYFGRPLEKLNVFFEGVQSKVSQGVKEEEISFQLAFSKQELRKVLQLVTLKEVRKGLEEMYKRIEKHAYEPDSNLTQVIWHAMQDEFLSQYKAIQGMIERCYPGTNLSLTFTIEDLLRVFEDIARSH